MLKILRIDRVILIMTVSIAFTEFELFDKTDKKVALDGEIKKFEESKLTELQKWLRSKNGFNR